MAVPHTNKGTHIGWWEERSGLADSVAIVTGGAGGLGESVSRDPDTLDRLFDEVDDRRQRLDILVNVVGGTFASPF